MFNPLKPEEGRNPDISNVDAGPPPERKWGLEITSGVKESGASYEKDRGPRKTYLEDIPHGMDGWADTAGGAFSGAVSGAPFMLAAALLVVLGLFYLYQRETAARVEKMESSMATLSENLAQQKRKNMRAGMAMARAELARAIAALDRVIALKDPKLTRDALRLREEAKRAMVELEAVPLEPETASPDIPKAPVDQPADPEDALAPAAPGADESSARVTAPGGGLA